MLDDLDADLAATSWCPSPYRRCACSPSALGDRPNRGRSGGGADSDGRSRAWGPRRDRSMCVASTTRSTSAGRESWWTGCGRGASTRTTPTCHLGQAGRPRPAAPMVRPRPAALPEFRERYAPSSTTPSVPRRSRRSSRWRARGGRLLTATRDVEDSHATVLADVLRSGWRTQRGITAMRHGDDRQPRADDPDAMQWPRSDGDAAHLTYLGTGLRLGERGVPPLVRGGVPSHWRKFSVTHMQLRTFAPSGQEPARISMARPMWSWSGCMGISHGASSSS